MKRQSEVKSTMLKISYIITFLLCITGLTHCKVDFKNNFNDIDKTIVTFIEWCIQHLYSQYHFVLDSVTKWSSNLQMSKWTLWSTTMIFNTQENKGFVEIELKRSYFSIFDLTIQYIYFTRNSIRKTGYLQIIKLGKWQHWICKLLVRFS